ncbi:hypothetical protein OBBRIDRAFT_836952 [Obba rivulosa]|uniref:Uncharacterized protein n=1 Tax=Obba rivulosa TaxID=1052685 RepID=A0A8E2DHB6_9APHY|nr:hypothetical protein OBBRIDRAFT_836952 [Obba rivulosa]
MSAMSPTVSTATFVANPVSSSHYTFTNTLASTHIPAFASTLASLHTDASANSSFTPQTTLYNADTSHQATAGVYQAAAQVLGQSLPATRAHNGHTPQHQIPFSNGSYASPPAPIAQSGIGQAVTSVNQSQDFAPAPRMPLAILSRQQQSVQVAAQTQSVPPNGFHQAPHSYPTQPLPAQSGFASPPTQSQIGPSRSTTHQYRDGSQILSSPRPPKRAAPDTVHQEAPPIKSTRRTINQSHQSAAPSPSIQAYLPMTTGQAPTTNPVPPRPGVARAAAHKETPHHIPAQSTFDQRPVVTPNPTVSQVPRTKDPRRRSNNQSTQQRPPAVAQTPAPQPAPAPRPESSRKRPAPDTIHERAPATKIARKADVQGPSAPPNIYSTNAQPVQKQVLMNQTSPQTQMHIARPQATASTTRTLPQGVQNLHRPFLACSTGPLSHLVKSVQDIKFPELRRDDETEELVIDWKIPPAEFVNQCQAVAVQMKELVPPKPVPFCGSLRDLERRQPEQLVSARSPQAAEMSKLLDNLRFWANTVAERANGGVDAAIADNPVIIPAAASRDSADLRTGKSIVKSEPQEVTLAPMSSVPDDVVFQGILAEVIHIEDCLPDM